MQSVVLEPKNVRRVDAQGKTLGAHDFVTLNPGEAVRFRLEKRVNLAPNRYRGTLTIRFPEGKDAPPPHIYGVLLAQANVLTVKGWF